MYVIQNLLHRKQVLGAISLERLQLIRLPDEEFEDQPQLPWEEAVYRGQLSVHWEPNPPRKYPSLIHRDAGEGDFNGELDPNNPKSIKLYPGFADSPKDTSIVFGIVDSKPAVNLYVDDGTKKAYPLAFASDIADAGGFKGVTYPATPDMSTVIPVYQGAPNNAVLDFGFNPVGDPIAVIRSLNPGKSYPLVFQDDLDRSESFKGTTDPSTPEVATVTPIYKGAPTNATFNFGFDLNGVPVASVQGLNPAQTFKLAFENDMPSGGNVSVQTDPDGNIALVITTNEGKASQLVFNADESLGFNGPNGTGDPIELATLPTLSNLIGLRAVIHQLPSYTAVIAIDEPNGVYKLRTAMPSGILWRRARNYASSVILQTDDQTTALSCKLVDAEGDGYTFVMDYEMDGKTKLGGRASPLIGAPSKFRNILVISFISNGIDPAFEPWYTDGTATLTTDPWVSEDVPGTFPTFYSKPLIADPAEFTSIESTCNLYDGGTCEVAASSTTNGTCGMEPNDINDPVYWSHQTFVGIGAVTTLHSYSTVYYRVPFIQ